MLVIEEVAYKKSCYKLCHSSFKTDIRFCYLKMVRTSHVFLSKHHKRKSALMSIFKLN